MFVKHEQLDRTRWCLKRSNIQEADSEERLLGMWSIFWPVASVCAHERTGKVVGLPVQRKVRHQPLRNHGKFLFWHSVSHQLFLNTRRKWACTAKGKRWTWLNIHLTKLRSKTRRERFPDVFFWMWKKSCWKTFTTPRGGCGTTARQKVKKKRLEVFFCMASLAAHPWFLFITFQKHQNRFWNEHVSHFIIIELNLPLCAPSQKLFSLNFFFLPPSALRQHKSLCQW